MNNEKFIIKQKLNFEVMTPKHTIKDVLKEKRKMELKISPIKIHKV